MPINNTIKEAIKENCKERGVSDDVSNTLIAWLENQSNEELDKSRDIDHIKIILEQLEEDI